MMIDPETLPTSLWANNAAADPDRAARQPVADPLWFLLRQAALGEFAADDIGSPALVRVTGQANTMTAVQGAQDRAPRPFDPRLMPLDMALGADPEVLNRPLQAERISAGLDALRLMRDAGVPGGVLDALRRRFPLPDPGTDADGLTALHRARAIDGFALRDTFRNAPPALMLETLGLDRGFAGLAGLSDALLDWADALRAQPYGGAWQPETLDHAAVLFAPAGVGPAQPPADPARLAPHLPLGGLADAEIAAILGAGSRAAFGATGGGGATTEAHRFVIARHRGGPLDWWDLRHDGTVALPEAQVGHPAPPFDQVRVPVPVRMPGQPLPRLWSVEPPGENYSHLDPAPEDLARLVVADFALGGADGWSIVPLDVIAGSVMAFDGVVLRDVFGRETTARAIRPSASDPFAFCQLGGPGDDPVALLTVMPVLPTVLRGPPVERVALRRDEAANLVWAVEDIAPDPLTGRPMNRAEALLRRPEPDPPARVPTDAALAYRIATPVPENWIPFRIETAASGRVLAQARLLDAARDKAPVPLGRILAGTRHIADEAVPAAGALVDRQAHRVRWVGGGTRGWIARARTDRRPAPGASGLIYDTLAPVTGAARRAPTPGTRVSMMDVAGYAGAPRRLSALIDNATGRTRGSLRDAIASLADRNRPEGPGT